MQLNNNADRRIKVPATTTDPRSEELTSVLIRFDRLETRVEMLWDRERKARERDFDHPEDFQKTESPSRNVANLRLPKHLKKR